jgi:hypothetical protein
LYILGPELGTVDAVQVIGTGEVSQVQSLDLATVVKDLPICIQGIERFIESRK